MTNFDRKAWRSTKQAQRIRRYRRRMEQATREADPAPWLAALKRDDLTDMAERKQPMNERPT